jgi:hypothetical protein
MDVVITDEVEESVKRPPYSHKQCEFTVMKGIHLLLQLAQHAGFLESLLFEQRRRSHAEQMMSR